MACAGDKERAWNALTLAASEGNQSSKASFLKMTPHLLLRISVTIQRNEGFAKVWRTVFSSFPPPTSTFPAMNRSLLSCGAQLEEVLVTHQRETHGTKPPKRWSSLHCGNPSHTCTSKMIFPCFCKSHADRSDPSSRVESSNYFLGPDLVNGIHILSCVARGLVGIWLDAHLKRVRDGRFERTSRIC